MEKIARLKMMSSSHKTTPLLCNTLQREITKINYKDFPLVTIHAHLILRSSLAQVHVK